jgi:DNA-binding protein YbaB
MFDKFKAVGAVAGLLKNQDKLRESAANVKGRMERLRLEGVSGGGACRATVNGQMKVLEVVLSPALTNGIAADEKTRQLAGNLIAEAVNDALGKAQTALKEAIEKEARDLGLPADMSGLSGLLG